MHFQFLIEDKSGGILVEQVMELLKQTTPTQFTYDCKPFCGIGGFRKKTSPAVAKTKKLLTDLPIYLRGFNNSLNVPNYTAALIIVLDCDQRDPVQFRQELEAVARAQEISIDYVYCIAIEEMEAWLLGDRDAVLMAYPNARIPVLNSYVQDSICGTWEKLADAIYHGGLSQFKKDCPTYRDRGAYKCEWARNIGSYMNIHNNKSESFRAFIQALEARLSKAS